MWSTTSGCSMLRSVTRLEHHFLSPLRLLVVQRYVSDGGKSLRSTMIRSFISPIFSSSWENVGEFPVVVSSHFVFHLHLTLISVSPSSISQFSRFLLCFRHVFSNVSGFGAPFLLQWPCLTSSVSDVRTPDIFVV